MNFVFLILSIVLLLVPVVLHLVAGTLAHGNFKRILWVSFGYMIVFSSLTGVLKMLGIFSYDYTETTALTFRTLPVEQYLLHFGFCFFGLSVYQFFNERFPNNELQKYSLALSNLLLGLCVAFLFFAYDKWYTVITFGLMFIVLFIIEYVGKLRFMYKAYRTALFLLLPFYIVYAVIMRVHAIKANASEIVGLNLFDVPIETACSFFSAILLAIYMFEYLKSANKA